MLGGGGLGPGAQWALAQRTEWLVTSTYTQSSVVTKGSKAKGNLHTLSVFPPASKVRGTWNDLCDVLPHQVAMSSQSLLPYHRMQSMQWVYVMPPQGTQQQPYRMLPKKFVKISMHA